jgi:hypothetical protein
MDIRLLGALLWLCGLGTGFAIGYYIGWRGEHRIRELLRVFALAESNRLSCVPSEPTWNSLVERMRDIKLAEELLGGL